MRISDWSSDVCSSDLHCRRAALWPAASLLLVAASPSAYATSPLRHDKAPSLATPFTSTVLQRAASGSLLTVAAIPIQTIALHAAPAHQIGRASCREGVCQYV